MQKEISSKFAVRFSPQQAFHYHLQTLKYQIKKNYHCSSKQKSTKLRVQPDIQSHHSLNRMKRIPPSPSPRIPRFPHSLFYIIYCSKRQAKIKGCFSTHLVPQFSSHSGAETPTAAHETGGAERSTTLASALAQPVEGRMDRRTGRNPSAGGMAVVCMRKFSIPHAPWQDTQTFNTALLLET